MKITKRFFSEEKQYFNRLSIQAQKLIAICFFFNLILPIFTIFTNAFIWRQSENIILVALFNLAVYIALPIGYYLNGHLLQKFLPSRLYFAGILSQTFFTAALIFSPGMNSISVFNYGMLIGLSAGILWANRNLLVLRITLNENRIYFTSLDMTINMITNIIIPLAIGTFIVFGQTANFYTPIQAYYVLCLLMFVVVFFIFKRIKTITTKLPQLNEIYLKKPTKNWQKMRLFSFTNGMLGGLMGFIPIIMVLSFIGKEDTLGTVQSLSAVIAAIVVYSLGKKITHEKRLWIIGVSVVCSILAGLTFAILYSQIGVFIFFALQALAMPLSGIGYSSFYFSSIDKENETKENHYSHLFDSEVFLNIGRSIGVMSFLLIIQLTSTASALRYSLLFFTFFQIILYITAKSIQKTNQATMNDFPLTAEQI